MKRMSNNCNCHHGLSLRPFQIFQKASLRKAVQAAMILGFTQNSFTLRKEGAKDGFPFVVHIAQQYATQFLLAYI